MDFSLPGKCRCHVQFISIIRTRCFKTAAMPILNAVPRDCTEYGEANRLLKFLDFFLPLNEHEIPPTSLLREFLGGSSFKY